jgi:predicted phosphodiesterase
LVEGPFEAIVVAGDLCLGGSDPTLCLDLLQEVGALAVYGNTEAYLCNPEQNPLDDLHRKQWDVLLPPIHWTNAQLTGQQYAWIKTLPRERRFSPTNNPSDDLVVVHANPKNLELMIYPSMEEQARLDKEIYQPDDDPALCEMLADLQASVLAFGHFHYTSVRRWHHLTLVNVAACSLPTIDHDPRARYTIFTWRGMRWEFSRIWVPYEVDRELAALRTCGMPNWQRFANTFR